MAKAGRPLHEKIKRTKRWTSFRLPIPVLHSLRWAATVRRHTVQLFMRLAISDLIEEVDAGKIDTTYPANNWYNSVTAIYGVEVTDAMLFRAKQAADKLYHSTSSFFALAIIRAVSKALDPENKGIEFTNQNTL